MQGVVIRLYVLWEKLSEKGSKAPPPPPPPPSLPHINIYRCILLYSQRSTNATVEYYPVILFSSSSDQYLPPYLSEPSE